MAKDSKYLPLILRQGVTNRQAIRMVSPAGVVLDPVALGYTGAILQVRTAALSEGGDLLLNLTTTNGGIVLGLYTDDNGRQHSWRIYVSQMAASLLTPWGEAVYDTRFTHASGQVDAGPYGPAYLIPAVTEV